MCLFIVYVDAMSQSVQGITAHTQIQQQTVGNADSKQYILMPCVHKLCIYVASIFITTAISPSYYSHTHISHIA